MAGSFIDFTAVLAVPEDGCKDGDIVTVLFSNNAGWFAWSSVYFNGSWSANQEVTVSQSGNSLTVTYNTTSDSTVHASFVPGPNH